MPNILMPNVIMPRSMPNGVYSKIILNYFSLASTKPFCSYIRRGSYEHLWSDEERHGWMVQVILIDDYSTVESPIKRIPIRHN